MNLHSVLLALRPHDVGLMRYAIDVVMQVSDEEVVFLTGGDPKDDAANMKMLHPGCKLMLVTEGGEGCRFYTPVNIFAIENQATFLCNVHMTGVIFLEFDMRFVP